MSEVRRTNKVITLLVSCLGTFVILLDTSIVILAVPRIQTDLHANLSDLQWVVDAYTLPFAVLLLTAGTFGDRFGRKRMFVIGLLVFVLDSACCGFAPALGWLFLGRVVQGIGAAALSTNSLAILAAAFSDPRERAGTAIHDGGQFGLLSQSLDSTGDSPYPCFSRSSPCSPFQAARMSMAVHVFLFLLVVCLHLSLTLLWRLDWFHLRLSYSRGGAKRTTLHRLLKPRSPHDCPACRLASTPSSGGGPAPAPVRPWPEVKSRRGAPKRIDTEGFACPNRLCPYFGITDAQIHALVGAGKHGQAERIQSFRCQACRTTFTARRHTPLYRLKPPSHQVAVVLSALAEGLDASAAERVFGHRQTT